MVFANKSDYKSVLLRLDDATVGLAGKTTAIGDALGLAVKHLKSAPIPGRVIILLTDGVNNSGILSPEKAVELAASQHIKVYTIGLGTETHNEGNAFLNFNLSAELDETTLKQIATITGGRYFLATDPISLRQIYTTIDKLESVSQKTAKVRPQIDYYHWLLALVWMIWLLWLLIEERA